MFSLRLFLLNHSPLYAWKDLPPDLREHFALNALLKHAEFFMADPRRRLFQFELVEESPIADAVESPRHRADIVILQSWGLMTFVRLGAGPKQPPEFTGLRDNVIVSASYVARRKPRATARG